jgi:hypothetical protein
MKTLRGDAGSNALETAPPQVEKKLANAIYFGLSPETSRCLVGASAPRCRVVPSVTLGGEGISSPV